MTGSPLTDFVHRMFNEAVMRGQTDAQLIERFAIHRDETAFALLVERHGPIVLGTCRQVLRNSHDAEDVFQATFLMLARKAGTLREGQAVRGWLYRTAIHLSRNLRTADARRLIHERRTARDPMSDAEPPVTLEEFRAAVHEEISGLPQKYRLPVLLCHLEGRTHDEAAAELGWPVGTIRSRLSRARDLLRVRLERRGVTFGMLMRFQTRPHRRCLYASMGSDPWPVATVGTMALGILSAGGTKAAVPPTLAATTARAAVSYAADPTTIPVGVSAAASALAEGALRAGSVRLNVLVVTVLMFVFVGTGLGIVLATQIADRPSPPAELAQAPGDSRPAAGASAPGTEVDEEILVTPVLNARYIPPPECISLKGWVDVSMGTKLVVKDGQLWAFLGLQIQPVTPKGKLTLFGDRVGVTINNSPGPPLGLPPSIGPSRPLDHWQGYIVYQPPAGNTLVALGKGQSSESGPIGSRAGLIFPNGRLPGGVITEHVNRSLGRWSPGDRHGEYLAYLNRARIVYLSGRDEPLDENVKLEPAWVQWWPDAPTDTPPRSILHSVDLTDERSTENPDGKPSLHVKFNPVRLVVRRVPQN